MATDGGMRLEEVLDLDGDEVPLAPLVDAVTDVDEVLIGVFTDEELAWAAPHAPTRGTAEIDEPRLCHLDEDERDVALGSAMWSLIARGQATWDGRDLRLHGLPAVVGDLRDGAEAFATVRTEVTADAAATAGLPTVTQLAVYRVRPDLFVLEQVAPEGLHRLVACSPERAAERLAERLDPLRRATSTGVVAKVTATDDLDPDPDELAATADASAFAVLVERTGTERAVTTYTLASGLYVLHGLASPSTARDAGDGERVDGSCAPDGEVTLQTLSAPDLLTYADAFLAAPEGRVRRPPDSADEVTPW